MTARHAAGRSRFRRGRRGEAGSVSAELAVLTPLMILLLLFVVAAGRLADARAEVDAAAHAAARAASLQRTPGAAVRAAEAVARDTLADRGPSCAAVSVQVDTGRFIPGGSVSVVVSCRVSTEDLTGLALPGAATVSSRGTSPVDSWRGEP